MNSSLSPQIIPILDRQRFRIAECSGWVWYRSPCSKFNGDRKYRFLALPLTHEYQWQDPVWMVRADGTERICTVSFMERDFHLPNFHKSANDCLDICESLAADGWRCELNMGTDSIWGCIFLNAKDESEQHYGAGRTMQLAFVEAFLRLHGKWTAEDEAERTSEPAEEP